MGCAASSTAAAAATQIESAALSSSQKPAVVSKQIGNKFPTESTKKISDGEDSDERTSRNGAPTATSSFNKKSNPPISYPRSQSNPVPTSGRLANARGETPVGSGRMRKDAWAVRPGYSSGASSYEGSDGDELGVSDGELYLGGAPDNLMVDMEASSDVGQDGALRRSRHGSECGALGLLRQTMFDQGCGLTEAVVRIETPFGKPIEEIYEGVHDGPVLGSGVSGIVRLIQHRATGLKYAVKVLDLGLIDSTEGLRQLRDEIFIMCQLDHPNIVRIEEVYESTNEIYIVQELCLGGDLFDRLDEQPDYHYTEAQCARLVKQMLSSADSDLRMIDFGLSKHFELGQRHTEKVGTPYTVAPEIIRGTYDEKSDIWSLGVITYLLLSGETPFGGLDGENLLSVKESILRAQVFFEPEDVWENVSPEGRCFVKRLLHPDPEKRPTARDAQRDLWIQVWAKKNVTESAKLNQKTVGALMAFKEYSDMQKLLSEVLSFTLLPEQIVDLKKEFEKIDTNGDGEISLKAMKQVLMENAEAGSLGALTEQEIEDIFDAIRIRKTDPTIRWHEFLAAGLSQARVDDRNLRLAFDRLDADRKGYVTFEDLQDLMGNSTEYEALEKIWRDSLQDCKAHLDRITYEDFKRIMKGQPKEHARMPPPTVLLSTPSAKIDAKPLSVVPEGDKHAVSSPDLEAQGEEELLGEQQGSPSRSGMKRSRSYEQKSSLWDQSTSSLNLDDFPPPVLDRDASRAVLLPGKTRDELHNEIITDSRASPLVVNRALYRKHREMRFAVLEASKQFDKKRLEIQEMSAPNEMDKRASLIMKRGVRPPVELEDAHQRALFEAAARRCGRARRTRNKTKSDVTGMLLKAHA